MGVKKHSPLLAHNPYFDLTSDDFDATLALNARKQLRELGSNTYIYMTLSEAAN
jgi:hypothetical protein